MEIKDVLAALLERRRMNANQLAEAIKEPPQPTIHRILTGESRNPRKETLQPIADYFGVTLAQLRGESPIDPHANVEMGPEIRGKVPLISWVQAGEFSQVVDNSHPGHADEWVETTVPIRQHTYALRVRGDSMTNPAGDPSFPEGSVIVVEPDAINGLDTMVGQLVIVKRDGDGEATFKKLVRDASRYYLKPLNPQYPTLELRETDVFCGVVRERVMRFF